MKERILPNQIAKLETVKPPPVPQSIGQNPPTDTATGKPLDYHNPFRQPEPPVTRGKGRTKQLDKTRIVTAVWGILLTVGAFIAVFGERHFLQKESLYILARISLTIPPLTMAIGSVFVRDKPAIGSMVVSCAGMIQLAVTILAIINQTNDMNQIFLFISLSFTVIVMILNLSTLRASTSHRM